MVYMLVLIYEVFGSVFLLLLLLFFMILVRFMLLFLIEGSYIFCVFDIQLICLGILFGGVLFYSGFVRLWYLDMYGFEYLIGLNLLVIELVFVIFEEGEVKFVKVMGEIVLFYNFDFDVVQLGMFFLVFYEWVQLINLEQIMKLLSLISFCCLNLLVLIVFLLVI